MKIRPEIELLIWQHATQKTFKIGKINTLLTMMQSIYNIIL